MLCEARDEIERRRRAARMMRQREIVSTRVSVIVRLREEEAVLQYAAAPLR